MMIKISFFVPASHVEAVKQAMFNAGAGKIGDYDRCSWQILGRGQFRPLPDSQPFIGNAGGEVESVEEYKVEMVCHEDKLKAAISALRLSHPYEEPAFDLIPLLDPGSLSTV
jgi:hypothetical protein